MSKIRAKLASGRNPDWALWEKFTVPNYATPEDEDDYLTRIRVIQTPWGGIFLHRFENPDPRDTLHDHPWPFFSIVLRGGYDEQRRDTHVYDPCREDTRTYSYPRTVRRVNVMPQGSLHWISRLHRVPTWTLMFVGRRKRVWGYLDRDGTWTDFLAHPFNQGFQDAISRRKGRTREHVDGAC